MEIIVSCLMLVVSLSFVFKLTLARPLVGAVTVLLAVLFTGLAWPWAAEQSKTQISAWLSDASLMTDLSVILSFDVATLLLFCRLSVAHKARSPRARRLRQVLECYPGLLIFPVLFSLLVTLIFSLPGMDFALTAWGLAATLGVAIPGAAWLFVRLLPERELRLEMLFILNVMTALLGIVGTVNGRTAVEAESSVNHMALAGVVALTLLFALIGYVHWRILNRKNKRFTPRH